MSRSNREPSRSLYRIIKKHSDRQKLARFIDALVKAELLEPIGRYISPLLSMTTNPDLKQKVELWHEVRRNALKLLEEQEDAQ